MGTLGVHQNIPASDTKLTYSLGIYSIGPPLVKDKLIPVNSRGSRVHRRWAPCMMSNASLQSSSNQGLSLFRTRITLVGTKRSTSRDKMHLHPLNLIVSTLDTSPRQLTYCIGEPINSVFQKHPPANTQKGIACAAVV